LSAVIQISSLFADFVVKTRKYISQKSDKEINFCQEKIQVVYFNVFDFSVNYKDIYSKRPIEGRKI
jgi:hypothetical protein